MTHASPPRRRRRVRVLAAAGLVAAGAALGLSACRSLPKDAVEERLLALEKNRRVRDHGLSRASIEMLLEGETTTVEVTYLHVAARSAPGSREPVVLVHGTPASLFTWVDLVFGDETFPGLVADRDVYVVDVIGHGVTRTETPPYSFQKCADFVAGAIEGLGLERVHLVCNSYGGEFCWRAALDDPDLFASLTLLDTSGYTRPDDGWLPEEEAMREMSLAPYGWILNDREKIREALAPHFPYPVTDDQVDEVFALCENSDNWEAMVDLARDENGTRAGELGALRVPTLLIWGADDLAFPVERDAERFARDIPGSVLRVLPDCGHYPQETRPADVARLLREHFERDGR